MLQGEAACPPRSRVASGTLVTDTGSIGGLPREVTNQLTQFNVKNGSATLAESKNPDTRVVSRARIEGNVVTVNVPAVPGGPPPDPYTAFKHFEVAGEASPGGEPYLLTPPFCPAAGHWTNRLTFTYRDGVVERTQSRSPCRPESGDRAKPRIRLRGHPERGCAERGFFARVRIRDRSPLRHARLRIDGRRVRSTSRKRFSKYVPAKRLGAGRHRITVRAKDAAANRARKSASFRSCAHG